MPSDEELNLNIKQLCEVKSNFIAARTIERYSFGSEIRKALKLPKFFPLYIYAYHGVYLWNKPHVRELKTKYYGVLLFTEELKEKWEKEVRGSKMIRVMPHPYILYLKRTQFKLNRKRHGSLFFFSHSTWDTEVETNYDAIKTELDSLESQFKPVRIVLHFIDVLKDKHIIFEQLGYETICFGNMYNEAFVDNLYNAFKTTKFVLSNTIGSHTFYAINIGLPFSLLNVETNVIFPEHHNVYNRYAQRDLRKIKKIGQLIGDEINYENSTEAVVFVNKELGVESAYSKRGILYFIAKSNMNYIAKKLLMKLKSFCYI